MTERAANEGIFEQVWFRFDAPLRARACLAAAAVARQGARRCPQTYGRKDEQTDVTCGTNERRRESLQKNRRIMRASLFFIR